MQFIEINEICEWCREHGLAVGEEFDISFPEFEHIRSITVEENGRPSNAVPAGLSCLEFLGDWSAVLVLVTAWGIWPSSEDWPDFYKYRGDRGEKRSLSSAPGHLFGPHESDDLAELLVKIMKNGWDAQVLCLKEGRLDKIGASISNDGFLDLLSAAPVKNR